MAQTYSFPILTDQELLPCLKEMDLPLNAAQLAKPTYELVRPVYESVVTTLLGVTRRGIVYSSCYIYFRSKMVERCLHGSREELQQPVFAAIDTLEFPELHDESIPFMAFLKSLSKLLLAAGVKDFSMQDVCKPEPARLRRNLSAIINFAKFREEKLAPYAEMQETTETLLDETVSLEEANQHLAAELRQIQEEQAAEMPEVARIEAEAQEIYAENQQLNKQQSALNTEVRALKQTTNTVANEIAGEKFKLQAVRQEAEKLRGLIVESPEKLAGRLAETTAAVERQRGQTSDAERRARDLQAKLDTMAKVEKDVAKAMALMREAESEIGRKKEVSRRVKRLRAEIAASEHEAAQLDTQQQHMQRQLAALAERLTRLEHQRALRKEAAVMAVEEQRKEKEAIEAENAANIAKIAENDAVMRTLRERTRELTATHEAQINTILDKFHSLRRQIDDYHAALEAEMGIADATAAVKAITLR